VPVGVWIRCRTAGHVSKGLSGCGTFAAGLFSALVLLAVWDRLPGLSLWNFLGEKEEFTTRRTHKLFGISVRPYPPPQGPAGFEELEPNASPTVFRVVATEHSDKPLPESFEKRTCVRATAADGTTYEAFTEWAAMGDIARVRHITFDMRHH